jgi:hypothetical protein
MRDVYQVVRLLFLQEIHGKAVYIRIAAGCLQVRREFPVSDRNHREAFINIVLYEKIVAVRDPILLFRVCVCRNFYGMSVTLHGRGKIQQEFFRAGMKLRVKLVDDVKNIHDCSNA